MPEPQPPRRARLAFAALALAALGLAGALAVPQVRLEGWGLCASWGPTDLRRIARARLKAAGEPGIGLRLSLAALRDLPLREREELLEELDGFGPRLPPHAARVIELASQPELDRSGPWLAQLVAVYEPLALLPLLESERAELADAAATALGSRNLFEDLDPSKRRQLSYVLGEELMAAMDVCPGNAAELDAALDELWRRVALRPSALRLRLLRIAARRGRAARILEAWGSAPGPLRDQARQAAAELGEREGRNLRRALEGHSPPAPLLELLPSED